MTLPKMKGWNVYYPTMDTGTYKWVTKVFFNADIPSEDVRRSLIEHDNMNPNAIIREEKKK